MWRFKIMTLWIWVLGRKLLFYCLCSENVLIFKRFSPLPIYLAENRTNCYVKQENLQLSLHLTPVCVVGVFFFIRMNWYLLYLACYHTLSLISSDNVWTYNFFFKRQTLLKDKKHVCLSSDNLFIKFRSFFRP